MRKPIKAKPVLRSASNVAYSEGVGESGIIGDVIGAGCGMCDAIPNPIAATICKAGCKIAGH